MKRQRLFMDWSTPAQENLPKLRFGYVLFCRRQLPSNHLLVLHSLCAVIGLNFPQVTSNANLLTTPLQVCCII